MDILKVVKTQREPGQGRFGRGPVRKELILIIYDTVWVHRIRERSDPFLAEANSDGVISVKAKYALVFTGPDDTNAIGQCYAMRPYADEAEWAHSWHDLPAAMERLRARHQDEPFPEQIDYVLDYPDYGYWQHLKSVSSPARQESIQKMLNEAGQS